MRLGKTTPKKEDADRTMQKFDVCIIGAGPGGLATLSALRSPYNLDSQMTDSQKERAVRSLGSLKQHHQRSICVIDPAGGGWLDSWQSNFDRLSIEYLRSPTLAHPDMFDPHALLSYAVRHGREDELLESGCGDIKKLLALGQSQIGLWKLPSTKLFVDFCLELTKELDHTLFGNTTVTNMELASDGQFDVVLSSGLKIQAGAVVLAMGVVGHPIVPPGIKECPHWRHWTQTPQPTNRRLLEDLTLPVMVVGGGLTAVQVALNELRRAESSAPCSPYNQPSVFLVSQRPLVEKHFDIDIEWFDLRKTNKCVADFYHSPMESRKQSLRQARRGGSVPPMYMKQILKAERDGRLLCFVGDIDAASNDKFQTTTVRVRHCKSTRRKTDSPTSLKASDKVTTHQVKEIILACGVQPECEKPESLTSIIQSKWPTRIESGLPCVTQDLRWKEGMDLFVVGALGSLNIGPDAGNLMGIRRAAQIAANALGSRSWLRESVLANPFEALDWSDSSDDENEDDDSSTKTDEEEIDESEKSLLLETSDMSDTTELSLTDSSVELE